MSKRTGVIRYNLAERGRRFRGQDRHFDCVAAARLINGPAVQEKVKHGDMLGYFGHWPRVQFGLNPAEGGVVAGRAVSVEPAIRTLSIVAQPDGTIDHEVEFLDTANGKIAARLYDAKVGGFSSAIRAPMSAGKAVPTEFHGFDFVLEPNYTQNRGYGATLDDAGGDGGEGSEWVFDAVSDSQFVMDQCATMLDNMQAAYDQLQKAFLAATDENTYYLSRLAAENKCADKLDGVMEIAAHTTVSHLAQADDFLHADLVPLQKPKVEEAPKSRGLISTLSRLGL